MPHNLQELIKKAAQTEATPALVEFWEKQYSLALTSHFRLDPDSNTGYINLVNHLTLDKKDIDHQQLQQTISVGVRFLDALATELDYREIRLSVDNFEEFLKTTDTAEQIGIDYVGSLVSDFSYRASENLAHEKGAFLQFSNIPKNLRNVEYEMWVDQDDNYKNGQELSAMFDSVSIASSQWNLVPRRNYAILDFDSQNTYWNKWKDAYQKSADPQFLPNSMVGEIVKEPELEEFSFDLSGDSEQDFSTDFSQIETSDLAQSNPQSPLLEDPKDKQLESTPQNTSIIQDTNDHQNLESIKNLDKINNNQILEPEFNLENLAKMNANISELKEDSLPDFNLNELSEPVAPSIRIENEAQSNELVNQEEASSQQGFEVTIPQDVIQNTNMSGSLAGIDFTESGSAALILNDQNQILLLKRTIDGGSEWILPSVEIDLNQIPEEAILKYLQNNLPTSSRILDEVGSVMLSHNPNLSHSLNIIYNVFLIGIGSDYSDLNSKISSEKAISFEFFDLDKLPAVSILVKVAIDKHFRRQKQLHDYCEHRISEWEDQIKPQLEAQIRTELESEILKNQTEESVKSIENTKTNDHINDQWAQESDLDFVEESPVTDLEPKLDNSLVSDKNELTTQTEYDDIIAHSVPKAKHPSLAKFKVKLEQWIESEKFGDIGLVLGYSSKGLETISVLESELNAELKSILDLILGLFNHLLSHGLDLKTLVSGLNLQHGNNEIKITQILSLILETVLSAPDKISEISDDLLI